MIFYNPVKFEDKKSITFENYGKDKSGMNSVSTVHHYSFAGCRFYLSNEIVFDLEISHGYRISPPLLMVIYLRICENLYTWFPWSLHGEGGFHRKTNQV